MESLRQTQHTAYIAASELYIINYVKTEATMIRLHSVVAVFALHHKVD